MRSLKDKFDELRLRLRDNRRLDSTGADSIFYLVFPVAEILAIKRQTKAWIAKLENEGWQVVTFSLADAVNETLRGHKLRKQWLSGEKLLLQQSERQGVALEFRDINQTLSKALTEGGELLAKLESKLAEATSRDSGLLLLTDLEALHPYLRINTLEAQLQGKVRCPVVVLYPGKREGRTSLRFLEFYPADPNYRSEHIG